MAKALTKEDLIYILNSIFRLSSEPNNSFKMLDDGIFVEDYHQDLKNHTDNTDIHIDTDLKNNILDKLGVNDQGELTFDSKQLLLNISNDSTNAIIIKNDGIYVENITNKVENITNRLDTHLKDNNAHVTNIEKIYIKEAHDLSIKNLYEISFVAKLPETPKEQTIYILNNETYSNIKTLHIFINDEWFHLGIDLSILDNYALKKDCLSKEDYANSHQSHNNYEILQKFSETDTGLLLYNGNEIIDISLSDLPDNALKFINGQLYAPDYKQQINSLAASSAFCKENLYNGDCKEAGIYELKGHIRDYSLLLIEYYYYPNDPEGKPGDAKSVMVDTDTMEELYAKGIDYMIELGHGVSVANSKIRIHDDKLEINYYHNICIYKITGIKRGDTNG